LRRAGHARASIMQEHKVLKGRAMQYSGCRVLL
jgi:hypothetical protein